nr:putative coat protein [Lolium latent virus]
MSESKAEPTSKTTSTTSSEKGTNPGPSTTATTKATSPTPPPVATTPRPIASRLTRTIAAEGGQPEKKQSHLAEDRIAQYLPKQDAVDHSNLAALLQPFTEASYEREFDVKVNGIASKAELTAVAETWASRLNVPKENSAILAQEIAIHCYHNGSSEQTDFNLKSSQVAGLNLEAAVGIIKEILTLRQFAAYYATFVWNWGLKNEIPPANWVAKGYTDETKYAAFDTFNYVGSTLGLRITPTRKPTHNEYMAASLNAREKIIQSRGKGMVTNSPMFSDGTTYQGSQPECPGEDHPV